MDNLLKFVVEFRAEDLVAAAKRADIPGDVEQFSSDVHFYLIQAPLAGDLVCFEVAKVGDIGPVTFTGKVHAIGHITITNAELEDSIGREWWEHLPRAVLIVNDLKVVPFHIDSIEEAFWEHEDPA